MESVRWGLGMGMGWVTGWDTEERGRGEEVEKWVWMMGEVLGLRQGMGQGMWEWMGKGMRQRTGMVRVEEW